MAFSCCSDAAETNDVGTGSPAREDKRDKVIRNVKSFFF